MQSELAQLRVAHSEPKVVSHRVPDDLGWELVTCIRDGLHALTLSRRRNYVRMPTRQVD
jgi:hypothetical protein